MDTLTVPNCTVQEFLVVVRRSFVLATTSSLSRKQGGPIWCQNQPTEQTGSPGLARVHACYPVSRLYLENPTDCSYRTCRRCDSSNREVNTLLLNRLWLMAANKAGREDLTEAKWLRVRCQHKSGTKHPAQGFSGVEYPSHRVPVRGYGYLGEFNRPM